MKTLAPEWHWEATGANGGKIIGSCKTEKELGEIIMKLVDNPETEQIRIGKFRRDYDPMIPVEEMRETINARGMERKETIIAQYERITAK
jgi:hypothetical protein